MKNVMKTCLMLGTLGPIAAAVGFCVGYTLGKIVCKTIINPIFYR